MSIFVISTVISLLAVTLIFKLFNRLTSSHFTPQIPYAFSTKSENHSLQSRLEGLEEYSRDPISFLQSQRKRLGDVFCVDLVITRLVFCVGERWSERILRANDEILNFDEMIRLLIGGEIGKILDYEPFSDVKTKAIRSGIMSSTRIQGTMSNPKTVDALRKTLESWSLESFILLQPSIQSLVGNFFVRFFLGHSFASRHTTETLKYVQDFADAIQDPIFVACPQSIRPFTPAGIKLTRACEGMKNLISPLLENFHSGKSIIDDDEEGEGFEERIDYFSHIVKLYDRETSEFCFGTHFLTILFGAMANLPLTVFYLMIHLSENPQDLERLRREFEIEKLERERSTSSGREEEGGEKSMTTPTPFLDCCLKEIGRMYSNLQINRLCVSSDSNFHGIFIPKNTLVTSSPMLTHRDPEIYQNPDSFDPSRHLSNLVDVPSSTTKIEKGTGSGRILQFSIGPHACPGEKLAKETLRWIMREIVLNYDWSLMDQKDIATVESQPQISNPKVQNRDPTKVAGEIKKVKDIKKEWVKRNLGMPEPGEKVWIKFFSRKIEK